MKKTLIALTALSGAAFATDYTTETLWTAEFGSSYTGGYTTTLTSPGKFWDADKLLTANGAQTNSDGRIHMAGGTYGDWGNDFELSLTLVLTGDSLTAGHISELKAGSTNDSLFLGVTDEGNLTLLVKDNGEDITSTNVTSTGTLTLNKEYSFTLTKIGKTLTLAAGNVSVSTTLGSSTISGTINNITIGGDTGGGNRVPVLVKSMDMSSVTLTPESPTVPEPTTATLSLLALAGLAARRRRK